MCTVTLVNASTREKFRAAFPGLFSSAPSQLHLERYSEVCNTDMVWCLVTGAESS